MGREAVCRGRWPGGEGEVKALLETRELILRGSYRRTIPLTEVKNLEVRGPELNFLISGEPISLHLGEKVAESWAKKLSTPPASLAEKLGIVPGSKVRIIGKIEDEALLEAVSGHESSEDADLSLAVVESESQLDEALRLHQEGPIWLAYRKGPKSPYGEGLVRDAMRARGYIDLKVSGVSESLSATKFGRRK